MKKILVNFSLVLGSLIVAFLVCEVVTRLITTADADGQVTRGRRHLLPYRFPVEMNRQKVEHAMRLRDKAYIIDHPLLGWTIGPDRRSENNLYFSNSQGIRSEPREYSLQPEKGVLRIALFGDSFTHGDEVIFEHTWGKFLEDNLNANGVKTEVLNFGVPGYDIGQAYLRWKYQGKDYSPHVAVFGFQAENIKRTVNIFRQLYSRDTWLVFSKPRFILDSAGDLDLINSPVIPPLEVPNSLKNLPNSTLAAHEFWYNPDNYSYAWWTNSRFLRLLYTALADRQGRPGGRRDHRPGINVWDLDGEAVQVSLAILRRFVDEVRSQGAIPVILHIPKKKVVELTEQGEEAGHYYIFEQLERNGAEIADPVPAMAGGSRLYQHSHFSRRGSLIVARVLAERMLQILRERGLIREFPAEIVAGPDAGKLFEDDASNND